MLWQFLASSVPDRCLENGPMSSFSSMIKEKLNEARFILKCPDASIRASADGWHDDVAWSGLPSRGWNAHNRYQIDKVSHMSQSLKWRHPEIIIALKLFSRFFFFSFHTTCRFYQKLSSAFYTLMAKAWISVWKVLSTNVAFPKGMDGGWNNRFFNNYKFIIPKPSYYLLFALTRDVRLELDIQQSLSEFNVGFYNLCPLFAALMPVF